ncbi:hypothetical protein C4H12_10570 [Capnocytophaga sp. oral taxon 878]|nr:hypothetical protein C4H12_10570 [Capnocytophaga sp. oral taxon 878]
MFPFTSAIFKFNLEGKINKLRGSAHHSSPISYLSFTLQRCDTFHNPTNSCLTTEHTCKPTNNQTTDNQLPTQNNPNPTLLPPTSYLLPTLNEPITKDKRTINEG